MSEAPSSAELHEHVVARALWDLVLFSRPSENAGWWVFDEGATFEAREAALEERAGLTPAHRETLDRLLLDGWAQTWDELIAVSALL